MDENRTPTDAPLAVTVEEAARRLGLSRGTAYRAVADGTLPSIRIGKRKLIVPLRALDEFLASAGQARP